MKRAAQHFLAMLCLLGLSACTSFNLTEQLSTRLVPVVVPDEDVATFYERDGKYYHALTIAMAVEHIPLLTAKKKPSNAFYHSPVTYTPDMKTAQTYLFQLTDAEAELVLKTLRESKSSNKQRAARIKSKDKPGYRPPVVKAADFDFAEARSFTHPNVSLGGWKSTRLKQFEEECPYSIGLRKYGNVYPHPIAALPAQHIPPSLAAKLAYGPVWVLDAAGNLTINTLEAAVHGSLAAVGLPLLGILYLFNEHQP